jgi:hypothetical protein
MEKTHKIFVNETTKAARTQQGRVYISTFFG